ncbi:MAG TPA: hypothetical protein VK666_21085 [Chryseolinea sp.]|nr:hypothetical protein [Chryseolinea sp.]
MMKKYILWYLVVAVSLISLPAFSQAESDSTLLGLPGDNLDLYAVLDLFQKSKTIEQFEQSLNLEKTAINNLDLDLDNKVDFIKVVTKNEGDDFTFVLQVAVSKTETQDVAVILVTKDKNKKIAMQIVGDKDLYGENYIVELKESKTPAVTANPAYKGPDTVVVSAPAKTTVVVVESAPIVQYVYSPAYVPYAPPYYYGYYPPYFAAFSVMAVGIYVGHHSYYHGGYGYHGNTVVIHNHNNYNNYNNSRNTSNTVNHNKANGNYNRGNNASTRPSTGASTRPSAGASTRPSAGASTRPSAGASTRPATGASNRQSGGASATQSPIVQQRDASPGSGRQAGASPSTRQSNNSSSQRSRASSNGASRYSGGGGGGSRGGGGGGFGGGSRGGGGGGRRR